MDDWHNNDDIDSLWDSPLKSHTDNKKLYVSHQSKPTHADKTHTHYRDFINLRIECKSIALKYIAFDVNLNIEDIKLLKTKLAHIISDYEYSGKGGYKLEN